MHQSGGPPRLRVDDLVVSCQWLVAVGTEMVMGVGSMGSLERSLWCVCVDFGSLRLNFEAGFDTSAIRIG